MRKDIGMHKSKDKKHYLFISLLSLKDIVTKLVFKHVPVNTQLKPTSGLSE